MMLQNTFCHLILKLIWVRPAIYPSQVERCLDYGEYSGPLQVIWAYFLVSGLLNSLPPGRGGCDFICVTFKHILVINILSIFIKLSSDECHWISLMMDLTDDESSLVQVMAWHHPGAKTLTEPMMTQLTDTYMPHQASVSYWDWWSINIEERWIPISGPSTMFIMSCWIYRNINHITFIQILYIVLNLV